MKKYFVLVFALLLSSCVTPMKQVDPLIAFDTEIGFKIFPPPGGPWYEMPGREGGGLNLGRKPTARDEQDGSSTIADVQFGFMNLKQLKLNGPEETLKFLKLNMVELRDRDRFESSSGTFKRLTLKTAQCTSFEQTSLVDKMRKSKKGESLKMRNLGIICLHPKDQRRYVSIALSERVPVSREFTNLAKDEAAFREGLQFSEVSGGVIAN